jgi:multidrug efflux pump subunit AcrB
MSRHHGRRYQPEVGMPQQAIRVDRAKVADLGLSVRDVTRLVETAIAGSQAGDYRAEGNSYRILVQLQDAERRSLDEVLDLTLTTPSGEQVALRNVVDTAFSRGPSVIDRKDQQRLAVEANVAGATWARSRATSRPASRYPAAAGLRPAWPAITRSNRSPSGICACPCCWRWCSSTWCWRASTSRCAIRWS